MKRKKILVVCQHYWPESFRINDIVDFFIEQDIDVHVLCGLPNYPSGQFIDGYGYFGVRHENHNNIKIDRVLEIKRGNNSNLRIFINYLSFPFFSLFHIPKLLFNDYDRVFIYQLSPVMMSIAGIVIGKIKKIPVTTYVLDLWPENLFSVLNIKNKFLRKVITAHSHWYYKNSDRLIVLSERMKDHLISITHKPSSSIIVLPQVCEKIYEKPIIDAGLVERFSKTFNILFTGNLSPAQSFSTIISAAKILKDRGVDTIRWIIVGDGMSRKEIIKEVENEGLSNIIIFEGQKPMDKIPAYTNIADILVGCLVKSELLEATIPAKVFSYIAAGKPIVLAMDGEVRSLVNDRIRCGIAGSTEDSDALADNIQKVYDMSKEKRAEMGENARRYHFQHFERTVILGKLVRFIMQGSVK